MGIKQVYFASLCLFATTSQCFSQFTGNQIQSQCQSALHLLTNGHGHDTEDFFNSGFCTGFIRGVLDLAPILEERYRFFRPREVTAEQGMLVLLKYLNENPQITHQPSEKLTMDAFKAAWPCH